MNLLVTGCCGFIGSNLCISLLDDGHIVTGIDSITNNYSIELKKNNLKELERYKNFKVIISDLLDLSLETILAKQDIIFHLAGQPSVSNSWNSDFSTYIDRNILLTHRILLAAKKVGITKIINSSSSSVYGRTSSSPVSENHLVTPISPYGVSKLAAENLMTLYGSEMDINTVSLRYFTVYGPRQRTDMAFSRLISSLLYKKIFILNGDGNQKRDFTFISDVVEANKKAAFNKTIPGTVLNIGSEHPVSLSEAIAILEELTKEKLKVLKEELGLGNPQITHSDSSAAKEILNWSPKVNIYEGLNLQLSWQKKNLIHE